LTVLVGVVVVEDPLSVLLDFLFLSRLFVNAGGVLGVTSGISRVRRVAISGVGSETDGAFSLDCVDELSNCDLAVFIRIELGDPSLSLSDISNNDASIVVALDVVPKLLGLRVIKSLVLVGIIICHDPLSDLGNLLVKLVNFLRWNISKANGASLRLESIVKFSNSDLSIFIGVKLSDP